MSTFNGYIKEYPAIAIDNFIPNNYSKYFVLSHVHKDHTRGLEKPEFRQKVYCSEATAKLLTLMETRASKELMYSHLANYVVGVEYYKSIAIETIEYNTIQLTFLPANHCLGASLILIEGENGTVLYTGDMRAEPSFLKAKLQCLKNYRIKNLYMDTTCCYDEKKSFVSKERSCELLANLIKSYSKGRHIYLDTWTVGYEQMWFTIRAVFGQKVHVSEQRYNMFCKTTPEFTEVLTTDASSTRFHSCCWDEKCFKHEANTVTIHPTPNRSIQPYEFVPGKQRTLLWTDLPYNCKPFQRMILPFSTHSSLEEIVYFYKFVKPRRFTPCVMHGEWDQLSKMMRLLEAEGCRVDTTSSSSDIERMNHADSTKSSAGFSTSNHHVKLAATNESDARSSVNYVSTAETSTAGSKTLSWPRNTALHSTPHSVPLPSGASNHDHSHSSNIPVPPLPVISEDIEENIVEERHNSPSLGDKRVHNDIEENPITEQRKSPPPVDKRAQHDVEINHIAEQCTSLPSSESRAFNENEENPALERPNSASTVDELAHSSSYENNNHMQVQSAELPDNNNITNENITRTRRFSLSLDSKLSHSNSQEANLHRSSSSLVPLVVNYNKTIPIQRQRSLSLNHTSKRQSNVTSLHNITRNSSSHRSSHSLHTHSLSQHINLSIPNNHIPDSSSTNVIFLSMTDSVCSMSAEEQHIEPFSILEPPCTEATAHYSFGDGRQEEKENQCENSDDGQRSFITAETTRHFLKSIKKVQWKKQIKDKIFGTKNKPICL